MVVCKFFLQGNCKFGENCKNEHPRGNAGGSNRNAFSAFSDQQGGEFGASRRGGRGNFSGSRQQGGAGSGFGTTESFSGGRGQGQRNDVLSRVQQPPAGPRGRGGGFQSGGVAASRGGGGGGGHRGFRGRGGFQGRGDGRRGGQLSTTDTYSITDQMLQIDLVQERPEWVCSCYGPGRDPPINLLGGSDLEISPEELRVDHYLKLMNNQGEESMNIENNLMEDMNGRINTVVNDPQGAIEYVAAGKNEHPNRHDIASKYKPSRQEMPWGQFSRDNQRHRKGVFRDQPRPNRNLNNSRDSNQNAFSNNSGNSFGPASSVSTNGFAGANNFGNLANVVTETSDVFSRQVSRAPALGQGQQQSGIFAGNGGAFGRPSTPKTLSQPPADTSMMSPTQTSFNQPFQGPSFAQPQQNGAFGQTQHSQNTFRQPQMHAGFQQPNPEQQPGFGNQANRGAAGAFYNSTATTSNNMFPQSSGAGPPVSLDGPQVQASSTAPQPPLEGPRADLKAAYDFMNQNGHFRDGFMPETAPERDWIS